MDDLDSILTEYSLDRESYNCAVRAALDFGKATLNDYYTRTDQSKNCRLAISMSSLASLHTKLTQCAVLNPRHKMAYFLLARWTKKWIADALKLLRSTYNDNYSHLKVSGEDDTFVDDAPERTAVATTASANVYDNLPALTTFKSVEPVDELSSTLR